MEEENKGGAPDRQPPQEIYLFQGLNNTTRLKAALAYAARGWPVFPVHSVCNGHCTCGKSDCGSPGKHPRTKHGVKDASLNPEVIRIWWQHYPDANVGIATGGESRLMVVDMDPRSGGLDSLLRIESEHGAARTFSVRTGGGGRHDYYEIPPDVRIGCPKSAWPGIDIRGDGGCVVAPPSLHASGNRYAIIDDLPLAPAPAWLLDKHSTRKLAPGAEQRFNDNSSSPVPTTVGSCVPTTTPPVVVAAVDGASEGERNDTLYKYACSLRARNVHRAEAEVLVGEFANRCTPPLPQTEASRALDSSWRHPPGFHCTDAGNAQRLAYQHGQDLRFIADIGRWIAWDGSRWCMDTGVIEITRHAKRTARSIYAEAQDENDIDRRGRLGSWAKQSECASHLEAMIKLARSEPEVAITSDALDANPMLLGVKNGTLDLRTGVLRAPERQNYITKVSPVMFDPKATCPRWRRFLDEIMNGNKEMISFMQRMAGYTLTGHTTEQCLFILFGPGANGKSVFTNILQSLLGDYACTTLAETLMVRRYQGAPMAELARLAGRRLVLASEAEDGAQLAESLIKQMTGGDKIVGRFLYRDAFEFKPQFKVWLVSNHRLIVKGDDHAIWRRIRLVPFEVTFPEHQRDPKLMETLQAELPGILNWALEGCLAWQREGLAPPAPVVVATQDYRSDMDWFSDWLAECCTTGHMMAEVITPTTHLHASYQRWAIGCGLRAMSKNAFGRKLEERGFERVRSAKARGFRDIAVRPIEPISPGELIKPTFIERERVNVGSPEQMDGSIEGEDSLAH